MTLLRYVALAILLASISCGTNKVVNSKPAIIYFPTEKELDEKPLQVVRGIIPDGVMLANDSLFIFRILNQSPSVAHFNLWNYKRGQHAGTLLPSGRKQGQSLGFLSYGLLGTKLWVNDVAKEKMIMVETDTTSLHNSLMEHPMPTFYYSIQVLNDSIVLASGDYESNHKIFLVNAKTGKPLDSLIDYKFNDGSPLLREEKMAYESFLYVQPSKEKCVLACRYSDQIEIVDLVKRTSRIVVGPEGYSPDVMVATGNDGKKLSTRNNDTRYSFVRGKTTDQFIYLLYSGNNHTSEHKTYGNCLYVYDWEGNAVSKLTFKDDVADFALDRANKKLYSYHPKTKEIKISILSE